jgi:hypothetical protein
MYKLNLVLLTFTECISLHTDYVRGGNNELLLQIYTFIILFKLLLYTILYFAHNRTNFTSKYIHMSKTDLIG